MITKNPPIRRMCAERLRKIVLSVANHRNVRKMLIHEIYPQYIFPVSQPFHVFKSKFPACCAVSFAKGPVPFELIGNRRKFFHISDVSKLVGTFLFGVKQHINPGLLMPRIHGHVVGALFGAGPAVFPVMPCP